VSSKPRIISRSLSPKGIEEKRAKNLCFLCDEAYLPGHKCKSQIYSLEVIKEVKDEEAEETEGVEEEVGVEQQEEPLLMSLNTLNGISTFHTMRVTGRVKNTPLHILIDSGSTHSFLDLATAKRLHCEIRKVPPLQVVVVDSNYHALPCAGVLRGLCWERHSPLMSCW